MEFNWDYKIGIGVLREDRMRDGDWLLAWIGRMVEREKGAQTTNREGEQRQVEKEDEKGTGGMVAVVVVGCMVMVESMDVCRGEMVKVFLIYTR